MKSTTENNLVIIGNVSVYGFNFHYRLECWENHRNNSCLVVETIDSGVIVLTIH